MFEIYGSAAAKAVLSCAVAALDDKRDEDFQFWTAVLACVQAAEQSAGNTEVRN